MNDLKKVGAQFGRVAKGVQFKDEEEVKGRGKSPTKKITP